MRALLFLPLTGCILSVRPLAFDFSKEEPSEALELTVEALEQSYAFTDWKALDWSQVRDRLAEAEDEDQAIRMLVEAIPDGHVLLEHDEDKGCPQAEGASGLLFSDTDDGEIVVALSQVEGVQAGDVLRTWNGLAPEAALDQQPLYCFPVGLATHERRRSGRVRLLGRGEPGATLDLVLERGGEELDLSVTLEEDAGDLREQLGLTLPTERISARMLGSDIGYLAVGWEETAISDAAVRRELRALWGEGARKLVLDLRNNDGGTDQTAANIAGVFTDRAWFYETITMYDRRTEEQAVISEVWVKPQELFWDLPTVVLINGNTVSSGEGMAMMLARFEGLTVMGFEGTAASFGSSGSTAKLPGGWTFTWPAGRSLDEEGQIQLDSDHSLAGGVLPTHRIPWTVEHRVGWAEDPVGYEIELAVELLEGL